MVFYEHPDDSLESYPHSYDTDSNGILMKDRSIQRLLFNLLVSSSGAKSTEDVVLDMYKFLTFLTVQEELFSNTLLIYFEVNKFLCSHILK